MPFFLSLFFFLRFTLFPISFCIFDDVYPSSPNILATGNGHLNGYRDVLEILYHCFRRKDKGCSGYCRCKKKKVTQLYKY